MQQHTTLTRREFINKSICGMLGMTAFRDLLAGDASVSKPTGLSGFPQSKPTAKRAIFLFQAGGPAQMDFLDYKPQLKKWHGKEIPKSVLGDLQISGLVSGQGSFPIVSSPWKFSQHGRCGTWVSEQMPHLSKVVDDICVINSMVTTQVDHNNAVNFLQTGHQLAGRPCMGAWVSYGLGSICNNLPSFVVLLPEKGTAFLHERNWGSGFLPSQHQGIRFGSTPGEPVPFLNNPKGINRKMRRQTLDDINELNALHHNEVNDPEIEARISQYEMAYRMQMSVPELANVDDEPESTFTLYGEDARKPGTYAYNCLLARRLAERGVRFTQIFQRGWDHHSSIFEKEPDFAQYTDQANAALIIDLKQRGMLDDTLVIWGGEFGRTVFSQGDINRNDFGRDHHPYVFTMWVAGGGFKPGTVYGQSDDFSYQAAVDPVPVHDFNATVLHALGINHKALTYHFQGRDFRLTDLAGHVIPGLLS